MTPARFRWGLLLVQIGLLMLLYNLGILGDNFWEDLLMYFPIVLIAVGVEKIFTRSKLQFISYLSSVFLFFGGLAIAITAGQFGVTGSFFSDYSYDLENDPKVEKIKAIVRLDSNDLTIRDSSSDLIRSHFARFTHKPEIDYYVRGVEAVVEISSRSGSLIGGLVKIETGEPQDWNLLFSRTVPLELECYGNEADMHLNLSTTPLSKLKVDADDARIYLKIGRLEPLVRVRIRGNESRLRLRLPGDVGIKVLGDDEEFGALLEQIGLSWHEDAFFNDDFETFDRQVEIELDPRLKSLSIDFF